MQILKIGGNELDDAVFLAGLGQAVAELQAQQPLIIVHGGGQAIAHLHAELGLPVLKVDGLRVTSAQSLAIAEMVLSGQTNKLLVRALLAAGVDALGISGVDGRLLTAVPYEHPTADLGYVGRIVAVRSELLQHLITLGFVPVVSPIALGADGQHYNVNADDAALAIAAALQPPGFDFISNVPGVLGSGGAILPHLTVAEAEALIAGGTIYGGMIPKVRAALAAVAAGVARVRIVNLAGLASGGGTLFTQEASA